MPIQDEITEAVLASEDVARYLQGGGEAKGPSARERVEMYLSEMRTTQRHSMYKVLKHPLYPGGVQPAAALRDARDLLEPFLLCEEPECKVSPLLVVLEEIRDRGGVIPDRSPVALRLDLRSAVPRRCCDQT